MATTGSRLSDSLVGGLAGAAALTIVHQAAKHFIPEAPTVDALGRRVLAKGMESVGMTPPDEGTLQVASLASDIAANGLFYSLIGLGPADDAIERGGIMGGVVGISTLALPCILGYGHQNVSGTPARTAMTFAWYLIGGLTAGAVISALASRD